MIKNMKTNKNFEVHLVDGGHHLHLDHPKVVGAIITKFINKYQPINGKL